MSPAVLSEIKVVPPIKEIFKPPETAISDPMELLNQEKQRMMKLASGISGGFNGLSEEASITDLSPQKQLLGELQDELDKLNKATQKRIEDVTGVRSAEQQAIPTWEEASKGAIGEEFRNAIRGESVGNMYQNGYSMREFVRKHAKESEIMAKAYEKQFGKPHSVITRAFSEVQS